MELLVHFCVVDSTKFFSQASPKIRNILMNNMFFLIRSKFHSLEDMSPYILFSLNLEMLVHPMFQIINKIQGSEVRKYKYSIFCHQMLDTSKECIHVGITVRTFNVHHYIKLVRSQSRFSFNHIIEVLSVTFNKVHVLSILVQLSAELNVLVAEINSIRNLGV